MTDEQTPQDPSQPEPPEQPAAAERSGKTGGSMLLPVGLVLLAVLAVLAALRFADRPTDTVEAHAGWHADLAAATAAAQASGQPIFVTFGADWCGACQYLESSTLSQPKVASFIKEHFAPVHVDVTDPNGPNAAINDRYQVSVLPTLLVLDPQGEVIDGVVGAPEPEQLLQWLAPHTAAAVTEPTAAR